MDIEPAEKQRRVRSEMAPGTDAFMARLRSLPRDDVMDFVRFLLESAEGSSSLPEHREAIEAGVLGVYFANAPYLVLSQIALALPYRTLPEFCRVNKNAAEICESELFWRRRTQQDFDVKELKTPTWKQAYRQLSKNPPVTHVNVDLGDDYFFPFQIMFAVDDENQECKDFNIVARMPIRNMNLRNVRAFYFHGSDGYPVVFRRVVVDNPLDTEADFYRVPDNFMLNVRDEMIDEYLTLTFSGAPVRSLNAELYDSDDFDAWLELCGIPETDSTLPWPGDIITALSFDQAQQMATEIIRTLPVRK